MHATEKPSKAQAIRDYKKGHGPAKPKTIAKALAADYPGITAKQVSDVLSRSRRKKKRGRNRSSTRAKTGRSTRVDFPLHSLEKVLRIPKAILDQNAGRPCTVKESATFLDLGTAHGAYRSEVSSATKFGLLERPKQGRIEPSELARQILRPQRPGDESQGIRHAALHAPVISDVYQHYRGENLPDPEFFDNALVDTFGVPKEKLADFTSVFVETLRAAHLLEEREDKIRVLDVSGTNQAPRDADERLKKLHKGADVRADDTCFVVMPYALPHGAYYDQVYEPAIRKAGLTPVRADASIFGAGKIMEQIWRGINAAKVLVAELTTKNPNVFYELGLAHALRKPVVLISSNEDDVPFDLQHIRVIYYDMTDPFWGRKLMDKVAENIISAIKNPEEAIFTGEVAKAAAKE